MVVNVVDGFVGMAVLDAAASPEDGGWPVPETVPSGDDVEAWCADAGAIAWWHARA